MTLTSLPLDILILILQNLSVGELAALSSTCQVLKVLVYEYGWSEYLRANPRPSYSLARARSCWSSRFSAQYDALTDAAWMRSDFIARPLSRPWAGKLQPILTINSSRLIVAAGNTIFSYKFSGSWKEKLSPSVLSQGSYSLSPAVSRHRDVTAITAVEDGGLDRTFYAGFQDGSIERITLIEDSADGRSAFSLKRHLVQAADGRDDLVESLSAIHDTSLSLTASGRATLSRLTSIPSVTSRIELNTRSWTAYLCGNASGPYAAFGTSSTTPLAVHSIREDQLCPQPTAILHTKSSLHQLPSSAVYGICQAPPASPWGSSPQMIISGWFDGKVRCYDLRCSSRGGPSSPVMTLSDPWSYESIYSISSGGGFSSCIAAGFARHSVVSFWDVRSPKAGWSVHAPGNDPSPVYSIILESSRLFGVTQSRPFVYDFGPEVSLSTYPSLPSARGVDGLKLMKGYSGPGFYVTTYLHNTCNDE
ncbi:hypothetical protein AMATHDRAFT_136061 [Amanita thiersii Skay4041]|uniref:F-box domain-containing protein n=1 Tax=Amanita thiersii Skay4041 TaxID=703135 RepID=A0A2A9P0F6_9AGAR|nr:hypothetical protein AMATHDRAFT_136061 [Amanita thiersii Skay4041]